MPRIVELTFELQEDVTPDLFAHRIAQACFSFGALRPGEGVRLPSNPTRMLIDDGPAKFPKGLFGSRRRTRKGQ